MTISIRKILPEATLPRRATYLSTGYDLAAAESLVLEPGAWAAVRTGLVLDMSNMEEGIDAQIRPRSGMALSFGVTVLNSPGTIDKDYEGEVKVILINHGHRPYFIEIGDRIAQLVFSTAKFGYIVDDEMRTARGTGGFGSSGT